MKLREFAGAEAQTPRLAALAEFLAGRAQDSNSSKTISTKAFINLAKGLGISITGQQLKDLSLLPPLSNIITNIEIDPADPEKGTVYFQGADAPSDKDSDTMTADQARVTVDQMAKRATKKDI